jgi:putative phage-type endonuclease
MSETSEASITDESSITDTDIDIENHGILTDITEDDIAELTETIYELNEDFMKEHVLKLSSPTFYEDMVTCICQLLFDDFCKSGLTHNDEDGENYDEFREFVENVTENYIEWATIPQRSIKYTEFNKDIDVSSVSIKINRLQEINKNQPKQKTEEWYDYRNGLLSASTLWKVFGSEAQRNSLIYEKCKPVDKSFSYSTNTESAMHWGVKYEPVTIMVYENLYQTKVGEFGCIPHPRYNYIGASPDGINIDPDSIKYGTMLEIKNIVNREITGVPKEEYWTQTQIQMETCDLDACDFVETRFIEYENETSFYQDESREYKGVILYFIQRPNMGSVAEPTDNAPFYSYMPLSVPLDKESVENWVEEERANLRGDGKALFTTLYWYLDQFSCVLILRNRAWFYEAQPHVENLWRTIEKERKEGYEHRAAKKREPKTQVVRVGESGLNSHIQSYFIENLNLQNTVRCVKIE